MNLLPLGGGLSAAWQLPDSLAFVLLTGCNLTGPVPEGWRLPAAIQSLDLGDNQLTGGRLVAGWVGGWAAQSAGWARGTSGMGGRGEQPPSCQRSAPVLLLGAGCADSPAPRSPRAPAAGTIPPTLTGAPSLQIMRLANNRLTGPLPAAFQFNTSLPMYGFLAAGNQLSGPVPSWPNAPKAALEIQPGNPGLCGTVRCGAGGGGAPRGGTRWPSAQSRPRMHIRP